MTVLIKNTNTKYGILTKLLHGLVGLGIIFMLSSGYFMTNVSAQSFSNIKFEIYAIHKASGVVLFMFILLRIIWKMFNVQPNLPIEVNKFHSLVFYINILFMYCLMFCIPLSGILGSILSGHPINVFNFFTFPVDSILNELQSYTKLKIYGSGIMKMHIFMSYIMSFCLIMHLLGITYNSFVLKIKTFSRIM